MTDSPEQVLHALIARAAVLRAESTNEAKTRLEIIDRVLTDVLGWSRDQFNPEIQSPGSKGADKRQWLDYHLTTTEGSSIVVEAKRVGNTFLFSSTKKHRTYRLQTLKTAHGSALTSVLSQAAAYCVSTGTFPFVVTNGVQWIASVAVWPGVSTDKIEAVVFQSLEDVLARLPEFIDLLSPDGVAAGRLAIDAVQSRGLAPTSAASVNTKIPHNPPARSVNYLAGPIDTLMRLCFGELTASNEDMLRTCYVRNEITDGYVARLETFVGDTLSYDLAPATTKALARARFARNPTEDGFTKAISGESSALLLVGRVGTGKSTFIEYATVRLREALPGRQLVVLHLDLGKQTQLTATQFDHDTLRDEVAALLLSQADSAYHELSPFSFENLKGIFSSEIQRELAAMPPTMRDAANIDPAIHMLVTKLRTDVFVHAKRYLKYLSTNRKIPVAVVFDNIDRGSPEFERAVFVIARNISADTGVTTLTALRETTYHNEKAQGVLDVGQYVAFTLAPPPFASVLSKRLEYAKKKLAANDQTSRRLVKALDGYSIETVKDFIEAISEIVGGSNAEIRECIQCLAATDVRRSLDLLRAFCISPNADIERLMKDYNRDYFKQPLDMFLRSTMCGALSRFVEKTSPIYNVFQVSAAHVESHFVSVRLLQLLDWLHRDARSEADVPAKNIIAIGGTIGFLPTAVMDALNRMGRKRLLLSRSHPEPPWDEHSIVRIGGSGKYYLERLLYEREYLKNAVDDTIIYDANVSSSLLAIHEDRDISWRDKGEVKLKLFTEYLVRSEVRELAALTDQKVRTTWCLPVATSIAERLFGAEYVKQLSGRGARRGRVGTQRAR